jgi:hypothetical protein
VERGERKSVDLDAHQIAVRVGDAEILVSWHAPSIEPEGQAHGAEGICVTGTGDVVVISRDGRRWELPAGRPEGDETWEQTLRREVREEACATVVRARINAPQCPRKLHLREGGGHEKRGRAVIEPVDKSIALGLTAEQLHQRRRV